MELGQIGIWHSRNRGSPSRRQAARGPRLRRAVARRQPVGRPGAPYLEAGTTLPVITGILNVWQHDPADVARDARPAHARAPGPLPARHRHRPPGGDERLHAPAEDHARVLRRPRRGRDPGAEGAAPGGRARPEDARPVARSARSAPTRTSSTPSTPASPASASAADALVAPEVAVVVEPDPETARRLAREYAKLYLGLTNYTNNLLKFGYTEQDIADGGSDRLIDAVIPHGSPEHIAEAIRAHLDAGADHVCLQPLGTGRADRGLPRAGRGAALGAAAPGAPCGQGRTRTAARRRRGSSTRSAKPGRAKTSRGRARQAMMSSADAEDIRVAAHRQRQRAATRGVDRRRWRVAGAQRVDLRQPRAVDGHRGAVPRRQLASRCRRRTRRQLGGPLGVLAHDAPQQRGVGEAERHAAAHRRVRARPRVAEADDAEGRSGAIAVGAEAVDDAAHRHHGGDRLAVEPVRVARAGADDLGPAAPRRAAPSAAVARGARRA